MSLMFAFLIDIYVENNKIHKCGRFEERFKIAKKMLITTSIFSGRPRYQIQPLLRFIDTSGNADHFRVFVMLPKKFLILRYKGSHFTPSYFLSKKAFIGRN